MKRILTLVSLTILLPFLSHAQLNLLSIDLGVKLGANMNQIDGKYWENGYKANFLGGAFLSVSGPMFGGQIEGLFTQSTYTAGEGFNDLYKDLFNAGKESVKGGTFKVNYLSVPLLLNIKLIPRVKFQVGPQFNKVMSVDDKEGLLKDARGIFKSGTLDAVGGVWVDLPFNLNIGARYIFGLTNINNEDGNTYSQKIDDSWKQKTLQVHLGYKFL
jgi:hypothetical protein